MAGWRRPQPIRALRSAGRRLAEWTARRLGMQLVPRHDPWAPLDGLPGVGAVIDVGVGRGTWGLYDRFPDAVLVLIDPVAECRAVVDQLGPGRDVRWLNQAVGDQSGVLSLDVPLADIEKSSLLPRVGARRVAGPVERREVRVVRLDKALPAENLPDRWLLKIDTEGFDLAALRGAAGVLQRCERVIVEASVRPRFEGSYRFEEIPAFMNEHGFRLSHVLAADRRQDGEIRSMDLMFDPAV